MGELFVTRRERWVAPAEDGGILIDPPLERVEELLETNRRRLENADVTILDQPFSELRRAAKDLVPYSAFRASWYGSPIIATGHQPDFFHPGVWLKNFAVYGLARRLGLSPLNVVLDTDTRKLASLNLPTWGADPADVGIRSAAYDESAGEEVYGFAGIRDRERFSTFADGSQEIWSKWPFRPMLPGFWQRLTGLHARESTPRQGLEWLDYRPNTSDCFTRTRQDTERAWGCENDEISFGLLSIMRPFNVLVGHVLLDLPRFHAVYNKCIHSYRRKYRLMSRTHPVPDLSSSSDELEAPIWWVDRPSGRRHRVFMRTRTDRLELRASVGSFVVSREPNRIRQELNATGSACLYPRALMTTMYLRLAMSDLFIHGIGGAKYDEVTDDIIRRYFGIEPPEYMVVSGTLRLPFPLFPATPDERRRLQRKLRDLRWHPEQFLDADSGLAEQKRRWIERVPLTRDEKRARYRELLGLTEALRPQVAGQIAATEAQLARCDQELAANAILSRRDYPFVLYPEEKLRPFLTLLL